MLGKVNAELRQYTSVNKKAADQYGSFKEEVEELKKRRQEMDASESAGGLAELACALAAPESSFCLGSSSELSSCWRVGAWAVCGFRLIEQAPLPAIQSSKK